jgi:hypothetical protein
MGASWVQQEILEEHPGSDLKVYVVWFNMLEGDSRQGWDGYVISDPRATNLWDEDRLVSRTLGPSVEGASPPVWDAYLLYGPEAAWEEEPPRPVSTGYTIYGEREELRKDISPLLNGR